MGYWARRWTDGEPAVSQSSDLSYIYFKMIACSFVYGITYFNQGGRQVTLQLEEEYESNSDVDNLCSKRRRHLKNGYKRNSQGYNLWHFKKIEDVEV